MSGFATLGYYEIGWDEEDLEVTELPVQFELPPAGGPAPTGGEAWTPGTVAYLRRVVYHHDGAAAATAVLCTVAGQPPFRVTLPGTIERPKEVSIDFGEMSRATARVWARRYLDTAALAREGVTIELIPGVGPQPYRDFGKGDTISVLGISRRVVAIGMRTGADSLIEWTVELEQPVTLLRERLDAILRRFMPGGLAGRTLMASPVEPSFPENRTVGAEKAETWTWHGDLGELQLYKNKVAITGALIPDLQLEAGETSKVTVTDPAREFVKNVDKITFTAGGGRHSPLFTPPEGRWIQEFSATADDDPDSDSITISVRYI